MSGGVFFFLKDVDPAQEAAWMGRAVATRGKEEKGEGSSQAVTGLKLVGSARGTKVSHGGEKR